MATIKPSVVVSLVYAFKYIHFITSQFIILLCTILFFYRESVCVAGAARTHCAACFRIPWGVYSQVERHTEITLCQR